MVPSVYKRFKDFKYNPITITINLNDISIGEKEKNHLKEILDLYGQLTAYELEQLSHITTPWLNARGAIPIDQPSNSEISQSSLKEFFKNKAQANDNGEN